MGYSCVGGGDRCVGGLAKKAEAGCVDGDSCVGWGGAGQVYMWVSV